MRISSMLKSKPLTLETSEGDVELKLTELSIGDNERYMKLMKPLLEKEGKVKAGTTMSDLSVIRVMCSLKHLDGRYYFDGELKDVEVKDYPPGMFSVMVDEIIKLEPSVEPDKTLATEKKLS